jgi:hypothetical protein
MAAAGKTNGHAPIAGDTAAAPSPTNKTRGRKTPKVISSARRRRVAAAMVAGTSQAAIAESEGIGPNAVSQIAQHPETRMYVEHLLAATKPDLVETVSVALARLRKGLLQADDSKAIRWFNLYMRVIDQVPHDPAMISPSGIPVPGAMPGATNISITSLLAGQQTRVE